MKKVTLELDFEVSLRIEQFEIYNIHIHIYIHVVIETKRNNE